MKDDVTPILRALLAIAVFALLACASCVDPGGGDPPDASTALGRERDALVAGLSSVDFPHLMGAVAVDDSVAGVARVPAFWTGPRGSAPNRHALPGTRPAPAWMLVKGKGRVLAWAGHEGAWTDQADGRADNDEFRARLLSWLLAGGARIAFSSGHGEFLVESNFSPALKTRLLSAGASLSSLSGQIDAAKLASCDLLVVGNPWGDLTAAELSAIDAWVSSGGSLLAAGLGWSWMKYHDDPLGASYPFNRLGARFGFRATDGWITDPDAANGDAEKPSYALGPLSGRSARRVVVLRASDGSVARVKSLAAADPAPIYVIQGCRAGLSLPSAAWASLADPDAALAAIDAVYEAEFALVGGTRAPYGGDVIWIVPSDETGVAWWMHAGNPVVYLAAAATSEIIPRLNSEGQPGWGVAHELGHDFHVKSCANLFVPLGTGETWPNVFVLRSYQENGWDWRPQMGASLLQAGYDHHASPSPDFQDLLDDPFVFLGCLDLVLQAYGWDGMRVFLTAAANDAAAGATAGDDAERAAYMIRGLSAAYGVDFSPLFAHWGFAVDAATFLATDGYADCVITW